MRYGSCWLMVTGRLHDRIFASSLALSFLSAFLQYRTVSCRFFLFPLFTRAFSTGRFKAYYCIRAHTASKAMSGIGIPKPAPSSSSTHSLLSDRHRLSKSVLSPFVAQQRKQASMQGYHHTRTSTVPHNTTTNGVFFSLQTSCTQLLSDQETKDAGGGRRGGGGGRAYNHFSVVLCFYSLYLHTFHIYFIIHWSKDA